MILGVDTGGTFTDFALLTQLPEGQYEVRTHKVLSTPDAPERAILQGITELGLASAISAGQIRIIHGSTVATNAALEGKGVTTAYITNCGFADMLTIGRQTRPHLYLLQTPPINPPVPAQYCLELDCRLDANGKVVTEPDPEQLAALCARVQALQPAAIAINFLFSYLNDKHERALAEYLSARLENAVLISCSSDVLPEYKEYERGIATWLNASLGPLVQTYLQNLETAVQPSPLAVMQSSGGTIDASQASRKAVNLLLSGPAGGLAAADYLSRSMGEPKLLTFDMGGTSTDVALLNGGINITNEGKIGEYPVAVPMVDMHTIGAGGGSIAYVDSGNLLQVGPQSAGASPGPACYGLGGTKPTVTDANLVLGRLLPGATLGATIVLDLDKALKAIESISKQLALTNMEVAKGIIRLANEHMVQALRMISVAKGHDPREFSLCCFGGAGGLHICALAQALEMKHAIVPVNAGVLSAFGMLVAPAERQFSRSWQCELSALDTDALQQQIDQMTEDGKQELLREKIAPDTIHRQVTADLRYAGQSSSLNVIWRNPDQASELFQQTHEERYGHRLPAAVELVNIRVAVRSRTGFPALPLAFPEQPAKPLAYTTFPGSPEPVPVYERIKLGEQQVITGPALITETNAATFVDNHWQAVLDPAGHLMLHLIGA